jgi:transposase InsO family protein
MPWRECNKMNERMKFVLRLESGEAMSDLCREFSISRKTGYKIWDRFVNKGLDGLFDESRKPISNPNRTLESTERMILNLKSQHPTWGAEKLREYLLRKYSNVAFPSKNTFHNILIKNELVKKRRSRVYKSTGTNLRSTEGPNELWCADFKGQFRMKNREYCYPLTITDHRTRFIIACEALESTKEGAAFSVFEAAFEEYGLPTAIRTDNGVPFCSPNALLGFSKLSVWWMRQGIEFERITPGHPEENGRHERMHLTLKQDLLSDPAKSLLGQQEIFDRFTETFNLERPHTALDNETPGSIYKPSARKYTCTPKEIEYKGCDSVRKVALNGKLHILKNHPIHISDALIKQPIGITQINENIWRLQFMDIVLGHYDQKENKLSKMKEIVRI